jgi:hypothetical protein
MDMVLFLGLIVLAVAIWVLQAPTDDDADDDHFG